MKKRIIDHPPKIRPFKEPKPTKEKISAFSLKADKQNFIKQKKEIRKLNMIIQNIISFIVFSFILFIQTEYKQDTKKFINKYKIKINSRFINSSLGKNLNSSTPKIINYSESIEDYPFPSMINSLIIKLFPEVILPFIYNVLFSAFYCSIIVLTIIHPQGSNYFFTLLFVINFFFSDTFILYSMEINSGHQSIKQSLATSNEYFLSILLLYSIECLITWSKNNLNLNTWHFSLCFSLFLVLISISYRIEYYLFIIPIIINAIIKISYQFSLIFVFTFTSILSAVLLILIDRFIGIPPITFDTISIKSLTSILLETDYNGMFLFLLILIIIHVCIYIPISILSKSQREQSLQFNMIFFEECFIICLFLFEIGISSANDAYLIRVYIIRLISLILIVKFIIHYQNSIYSSILLIISVILSLFYYIFNLSTLDLYQLF